MEDPYGRAGYSRASQSSGGQQYRYRRKRHGKKIPHDVGEYVPFIEYETTARSASAGSPGRKTPTESQITDVEWVDIEK